MGEHPFFVWICIEICFLHANPVLRQHMFFGFGHQDTVTTAAGSRQERDTRPNFQKLTSRNVSKVGPKQEPIQYLIGGNVVCFVVLHRSAILLFIRLSFVLFGMVQKFDYTIL